jgi:transposase
VLELDRQLGEIDAQVATIFRAFGPADATIITRMTGIPGLSAAEFVAAGGSSARFSAADQLAGYAGSRPRYVAPPNATRPIAVSGARRSGGRLCDS